jgi:hypothetical protein
MSHKKGKSKKSRGITVEIDDLFGESGHGSGAYALPRGSSHGAPEALGLESFMLISPKPTSSKARKKEAADAAAKKKKEAEDAQNEKKEFLAERRRQHDLQLRQSQPQKQTQVTQSHVPYDLGWMYGEGPTAPKFVYVPDKNGHGGTRRAKSKRSRSKSRSRSRSRAHR